MLRVYFGQTKAICHIVLLFAFLTSFFSDINLIVNSIWILLKTFYTFLACAISKTVEEKPRKTDNFDNKYDKTKRQTNLN